MTRAKSQAPLRKGWTTGACATAAVAAAYRALLTGNFPDPVTIALPKGERPSFALSRAEFADGGARAGVIKDAGDDPDVTHGAEVIATVTAGPPGSGVRFRAGEGVGVVTRPGLPVAVGEAAINPAPRVMMTEVVRAIAAERGGAADLVITLSIPGGEELARKTTNGRLGIVGGLSVLGTTGVVIPYSCSSWIHSIHSGVDVARASGLDHIAGATGRTSEQAVQRMYGLSEAALIDMGDFAGGLLKYLRRKPVPWLTLAGGFAKMCKLAQGQLYLHASRSEVDRAVLASALAALGAAPAAVEAAGRANTALQVLEAARTAGLPLAGLIARRAREVALASLGGDIAVDVAVFDRAGGLVGHAGP